MHAPTGEVVRECHVPSSADVTESDLAHVVVVGGTPGEWLAMSRGEWEKRLEDVADGAAVEGAQWVTVLPHHGADFSDDEAADFGALLGDIGNLTTVEVAHGTRYVWWRDSGVSVIVDPTADGHRRFAATVDGLSRSGISADDVNEERLSQAILDPADQEADLVVVLGPPDVIPDSMVWELAYSELVFIDIGWRDLDASHLELAIDDFNRRHRRFGGLDS